MLSSKIRKKLEAAITMRARAKALSTEAKAIEAEAKATILPLMSAYDLKTYEFAGVGTVRAKVSKGSSINPSLLRENMLIAGVDIEDIDTIIEGSTKSWSTEYVEFKGA